MVFLLGVGEKIRDQLYLKINGIFDVICFHFLYFIEKALNHTILITPTSFTYSYLKVLSIINIFPLSIFNLFKAINWHAIKNTNDIFPIPKFIPF